MEKYVSQYDLIEVVSQAHRREGPLKVEDSLSNSEQPLDPSEAVQRLDSKLSELRGELLETDRELKENRILRRMMEREDHALTELEAGRLDLRIHTLRQKEEKLQVQLDDLMETRAILAAHLDITRISAETLPNVSDLPDLSIEELEGIIEDGGPRPGACATSAGVRACSTLICWHLTMSSRPILRFGLHGMTLNLTHRPKLRPNI